jgi:hypothetical protein
VKFSSMTACPSTTIDAEGSDFYLPRKGKV